MFFADISMKETYACNEDIFMSGETSLYTVFTRVLTPNFSRHNFDVFFSPA